MAKTKTKKKSSPSRERKPAVVDEHPADRRYLSIRQLGERFGCSPATVFRHLPKMRVIKFGRRTLIPTEEADAYAASLMREPSTAPIKPSKRRGGRFEQRAGNAS